MPFPLLIPLIGAGIQTVATVGANIAQAKKAKKNTNLTIAENKRLAELAYTREQENIKAMNAYNAPKSQMDRFSDAGLNRALIYSQGTAGNQSQIAKYNPPNVEYKYQAGFKGNEFASFTDLAMNAQVIKNQIAQGEILKAEGTIKKTVAKYAEAIEASKQRLIATQADMAQLSTIIPFEKINYFFKQTESGYHAFNYELKEDKAEEFLTFIASSYLQSPMELQKSQSSIDLQSTQRDLNKKQLDLLNWGLPWATPFINFLRLLK